MLCLLVMRCYYRPVLGASSESADDYFYTHMAFKNVKNMD